MVDESNQTIDDLVDDLNAAIDTALTAGGLDTTIIEAQVSGTARIAIVAVDEAIVGLEVTADDKSFEVKVRLDTPQEVEYYEHGGILNYVLRQMAS